jgi:uncharacterized protein YkwD
MRHATVPALAALIAVSAGCDRGPLPPVTPTPGPHGSASPQQIDGRVLDHETGHPLARAVIVLSHQIYASNSEGAFHVSGLAPGTYPIEVYAPGHIALHQELTVTGGEMHLPSYRLSHLSGEEQHWLAQLNRDRAAWGAPPLVADEAIVEAARMRAASLATAGVFSHNCLPKQRDCLTGAAAELLHGAYQTGGENLGAQNEGSWREIEAGMLAEWTRCSPAVHQPHMESCSFTEKTGHFLNLVNRSYRFVGVAAMHRGKSFDLSFGPRTDYYAMEFE